MNARLSGRLMRYSIEDTTESAGAPRSHRRQSFALPLSILIGTVVVLVLTNL